MSSVTPNTIVAWGEQRSESIQSNDSAVMATRKTPEPEISTDRANLIFAPPNYIQEAQLKPFTQPNGTYRPPMKAAGDVSLSGSQLYLFLIKATMQLPQAKCEGVQLRLHHLQDLVDRDALSEPFLKKLNFVVDGEKSDDLFAALDRQKYDEAYDFYEQLCEQFKDETHLQNWALGLRLMICELKGSTRVGSAGRH